MRTLLPLLPTWINSVASPEISTASIA